MRGPMLYMRTMHAPSNAISARLLQAKDAVILIAPAGMTVRVMAGNASANVMTFRTVMEFEQWRSSTVMDETITADVDRALAAAGCRVNELDRMLPLLAQLRRHATVPHLKQLQALAASPRSFFRAWAREMPERPSVFLARVRDAHARRLLDRGIDPAGVAHRAGFASVRRMRESLA